ncbi:hypothetical protein D3C87_1346330 [compost metagenome]
MTATVVPPQHTARKTSRGEQPEDAFDIRHLRAVIFVILFRSVGCHFRKEHRWRKLAFVTDDHDLFRARNRPQRINGLYLTCLVHHEKVELNNTWGKKLGNGKRAHHEDGLERLDCGRRALHQLPDRHMVSTACHFATQDSYRADTTDRRNLAVVGADDFQLRVLHTAEIKVGKIGDKPIVYFPVEPREFRGPAVLVPQQRLVVSHVEIRNDVRRC